MFNWMSKRGKSAWLLMFFLFSLTMIPVVPAVYIASELPHPLGVVGFLYMGVVFFGLFWLWDRFYFKKKEGTVKDNMMEIEDYQNSLPMCDYRKTCIQHPLVCIMCTRKNKMRDCYKEVVKDNG